MNKFWKHKKVFITGHTGFKGGWLSLWLQSMGAEVMGYALKPATNPNFFEVAEVAMGMKSIIADIRDREYIKKQIKQFNPEIVIHMAAQPLVRYSYDNPVETYETNVMGTVNVFEAIRACENIKAFINVTTDKCYENEERSEGYREDEAMGGHDPYSSSKGCSELVTAAYRRSYFNSNNKIRKLAIASARAGNVIGGGDWSEDRLVPDFIKAIMNKKVISIRSPNAIRPWQHVLEPVGGYIKLAEMLYKDGKNFSEAWNFGPKDNDAKNVKWVIENLVSIWGGDASFEINESSEDPHEANYLKLDCSKAKSKLEWEARLNLTTSLGMIYAWHKAHIENKSMREFSLNQIMEYQKL